MFERKCLVVHFRNAKVLKQLHHLGHLTYHHKKRRYAVLYVDAETLEESIKKIQRIRHVRRVEVSPLYDGNGDAESLPESGEEIFDVK